MTTHCGSPMRPTVGRFYVPSCWAPSPSAWRKGFPQGKGGCLVGNFPPSRPRSSSSALGASS
ncbi:hypothetical protein HMPREF1556_01689 [Porphyromonas sp. oral taxon 278 str. W7784]|nr:hypothetical protein HMPREF1556_01689 [Porphyromonas sp. oral taxon 278 str. W7784]